MLNINMKINVFNMLNNSILSQNNITNKIRRFRKYHSTLLEKICKEDDINGAKWINYYYRNSESKMLNVSLLHGCVIIVDWLFINKYICFPCSQNDIIYNAILNNHIELVEWISNNIEKLTTDAMDIAASNGDLPIVKWLHYNRKEGCTTFAMDWAASYGHLDVVKWLHHNRKEGCTCRAIDYAASNGHIEIVKWLHDNRKEGFSKDSIKKASNKGHYEIGKLLRRYKLEGKKFY